MGGQNKDGGEGLGFFLVHLFHRQTNQRKTAQASLPEQGQQEEKETGLEQTADDSDVWFTLLFTSCSSLPFQHAALFPVCTV